jgi:hypothetical protein
MLQITHCLNWDFQDFGDYRISNLLITLITNRRYCKRFLYQIEQKSSGVEKVMKPVPIILSGSPERSEGSAKHLLL